ncbi:hypothetical protein D3C76_1358590 [compost metagenome]
MLLVLQLFAGGTRRGAGGVQLGLVGAAVETHQHLALLERLAFGIGHLDDAPGQFAGQHGLVAGTQHAAGVAAGRGRHGGRIEQGVLFWRFRRPGGGDQSHQAQQRPQRAFHEGLSLEELRESLRELSDNRNGNEGCT